MELIIVILTVVSIAQHVASQFTVINNSFYYDACAPSMCGNVTVDFPFTSSETFCGRPGFTVACDRASFLATVTLSGRSYRLNRILPEESLLGVSDHLFVQQLRSNSCDDAQLRDRFPTETTFSPFLLAPWLSHLNVSWCVREVGGNLPPFQFALEYGGCRGQNESLYLLQPFGVANNETALPAGCAHAALPVLQTNLLEANITQDSKNASWDGVISVIDAGFMMSWSYNTTNCSVCLERGGRCGYNVSTEELLCFCKDGCQLSAATRSKSWKIIVGITVLSSVHSHHILCASPYHEFVLVASRSCCRSNDMRPFITSRGHRNLQVRKFWHKRSTSQSANSQVKEFISNYKSMQPKEYSYAEVRKITGGFKEKLGKGGYGHVYKGKIPNGLLVAAKILEKARDDGRDFLNEVLTIGLIHHVNIIRLLGFCCDGSHRALLYEFMPGGSLADLISNEEARHSAARLLDIALGVARGIEYLHNGCEKRILHLDIKPQNVLLDGNFQPKISDFGLAKLYSRKESVISLSGGARGTAGYIAPEVFMRSLGGVSHKSDVYSFGMLLLEMMIGKKGLVRTDTGESGEENYFPNCIYRQLQEWLGLDSDEAVAEENDIRRKMVMVGLWCIQTNPVNRPSIGRALEMLRGGVESIQVPPQPVFCSLPKDEMESRVDHSDHQSRQVSDYTVERQSY